MNPSTPAATTPSHSRRKRPAMETQKLDEIIDLENDTVFISGSRKRGSTKSDAISVDDDDDDEEEIKVLWSKTPLKKSFFTITEVGESSASATFECGICADEKPRSEALLCGHECCADCTAKYVAAKLADNVTEIGCPWPECGAALEPERCRGILPGDLFERWCLALCEAMLLTAGKPFYCPFQDCSAALLDDGAAADVAEACCPICHRMFCARCRVAWHAGLACDEFQRLLGSGSEDLALVDLANTQQWKRCPRCKFYVERSDGCLYIKCRCGIAFCYNCGNVYTEHKTHFCTNCKH